MPDPAWPSSPPEANYLRLVGPGAAGTGSTLASAAAWEALMAADEMAASVSTMNTAVTALDFEGLGGTSSAGTAAGLNTALHLLAGWVLEKPPIAASAVAAYETAVSAMIPAEVSLANRAEQAADVAVNPLVLGALTPAIVALDLEYFGEHWPHNAAAGATYGSALTALLPALAVPPPPAPPGASPTAPATAAAAVAESAGRTAAGETVQQSGRVARLGGDGTAAPAEAAAQMGRSASSLMQPLQSAVQPLTGMFQAPVQAFQAVQGLSGLQSSGLPLDGIPDAPPEPFPAATFGQAGQPAGSLAAASGAGAGAGPTVPALTSYTRPTSSFGPENAGRPTALKPGLLSLAESRGPTTTTGAPVPVSPARTGMLGQGKSETHTGEVRRARLDPVAGPSPQHQE